MKYWSPRQTYGLAHATQYPCEPFVTSRGPWLSCLGVLDIFFQGLKLYSVLGFEVFLDLPNSHTLRVQVPNDKLLA